MLALLLAIKLVPAHVNESTEPVDNLGGVLSALLVGGLVVAINFLPVPNETTLALALLAVALVCGVLFFLRQRRAENPLYDLRIAARPTFWVAGCAGIIVFGSLMAAMFVNQQFLQNVLGYSTSRREPRSCLRSSSWCSSRRARRSSCSRTGRARR